MHAARFAPIAHTDILERELAISIAERGAATQAGELLVVRRRSFNADDVVLCRKWGSGIDRCLALREL